jgi:hypothetical protein
VTYLKNKIPIRLSMTIIKTTIMYVGNPQKFAGEAPSLVLSPVSVGCDAHHVIQASVADITVVVRFSCVIFEGIAA